MPPGARRVFWAGGCASCHAAPGAEGEERLVMAGGTALASSFGTFYAPNISPDPEAGIGGWSVADLGNAMQAGVAPGGAHLYPAFPYTSYTKAEPQDIADLHAFMATLPPRTRRTRRMTWASPTPSAGCSAAGNPCSSMTPGC
jgi:hypothetical protein